MTTVGDIVFLLIAYVPCALCVYFAGLLCQQHADGWGWFLFVAVLLGSVKIRTGDSARLHAQAELERARKEKSFLKD